MITISTMLVILLCIFIIYILKEYEKKRKLIERLQKDLNWAKKPSFSISICAKLNDNNKIIYYIKDNCTITERDYYGDLKSKNYIIPQTKLTQHFVSINEARQYIHNIIMDQFIITKESVDIETITFE